MKQTINLRQMGCIAGVMVFANKILVLPSLFYDRVGVDGLFILIGMFLVELLLLAIFFKVKSVFKTETFFQVLSRIFTKYGAYILSFLFACFFILKAITGFNISLMYLKNQVYFEAGEYIFLLCFLTIANNFVFKGLRSMSRTVEFFYVIIIILAFFCISGTLLNFMGFPNFLTHSVGEITTSSFSYLLWFGDSLFFFLIMDKIEYKKEKRKTVYLTVIINMIIVFLLYLIFYSAFRYTGFMHNNAASEVLTFSNKFSGIGRVDIAAVVVVMILNYFQFSVYNLAFDAMLENIIPKNKKIYSVVIFDVIFFILLALLFTDFTRSIDIATNYLSYVALPLQYIVPFACLIPCCFRRKKHD